jgi:16S rRNA A1518/A1519 N6-dimethyltransferase RsmA/KsgA/DIM1 with predicted DNA glycosylase/AP lyase activity
MIHEKFKMSSFDGDLTPLYDGDMLVPKPEIGQHILTDEALLDRIADYIPKNSTCVEIGPGPGVLTSRLLNRGNKVIAYEVDERCEPMLNVLAQGGDLTVNWQSFLQAPSQLLNGLGEYHIIGNIPYHISEPLMFKLAQLNFESAVLLIGERLANTITAQDPTKLFWSRMSLISNAYFNVERLEEVPRTSFDPQPRADGSLVRITRNDLEPGWMTNGLVRSYRALIEANETNSTAAKALKTIFIDEHGQVQASANKDKGIGSHGTQRRIVKLALKDYTYEYNNGSVAKQEESKQDIGTPKVPMSVYSIIRPVVDERLLSKPLGGIDNQGLKRICSAIATAINRRTK